MILRTLTIVLSVILPALILFPRPDYSYADPPAGKLQLTKAEKAWMAAHPVVRIRISRTYPPFEFFENGKFQGIGIDYLRLVEERLGIKFQPVPDMSWTDALESLKNKRGVDAVLMITHTRERESFIEFTRNYMSFPQVVFTRKDSGFISGMKGLSGETIATENGFIEAANLRRDVPRVKVIEETTTAKALESVVTGKADAYVGNLAVASYLIEKRGFANLKVASPSIYNNDTYAMGVRKDWPELAGILDKALASIGDEERIGIEKKWLSVRYEHGLRQIDIIKWVLIALSISFIFIIQLRRMVNARTKDFKESQEQLQKENERVNNLSNELSMHIRCMPIGCIVWDTNFNIQSWNTAAEKIFGFSAREAIGCSGPELIIPREIHGEVHKVWQQIVEGTGEVISSSNDNITKDGRRIVCKWSSAPLRDASDKLYGVLSMVEDVTEQVRTQEERTTATQALEKSEEKYRNIFEDAPVGIFQSVPDGQFITVNTVYAHIFGYDTAEEMISRVTDIPNQLYAYPEQREELLRQLEVSDLAVVDDIEAIRRDGSHIYISLSMRAMRNKFDKVEMLEGFLTDVTERKKFKDALEDSEKRFRTLIEESPIGIAMVKDGTYLYSNRAHAKIFGFDDPSNVIGTLVESRIAPLNRQMVSDLSKKLRCGEITSTQFETVGVRKNGTQFPYLVSSSLINLTDGPSTMTFGVDITERQQARDLMVQSEKMTMIAGMAAGIAHEVNNPLGIISQDLQNLERRFSPALSANTVVADALGIDLETVTTYMDRREITSFISTMRDAVKRASLIISNMLQFSRQADTPQQQYNINDVVEQSIELASSDYDLRRKYDFKNMQIIREYGEQLPMTLLCITEMEQVFINILKNAAQAMFEAKTPEPVIRITTSHRGDCVVVIVEDNGPGMSEEVKQHIYDPFFTTKAIGTGTGLGLSVSYSIVTKNHKGELSVESEPGKGARFTIKLPLE